MGQLYPSKLQASINLTRSSRCQTVSYVSAVSHRLGPTRAPLSDSSVNPDVWYSQLTSGVVETKEIFLAHVGSPETIFSFFELLLSSPPITLECVRLRSQGGHKPYFGVAGSPYSLKVRMLREPRPARLLWLVPGGGIEPPRY